MEAFLFQWGPMILFALLFMFIMSRGGCCGGHKHNRNHKH